MIDNIYIHKLLTELGICPQYTASGIRLGTTGWRLERGSGIAGNLHCWWLRTIPNMYHPLAPDFNAKPCGPAWTRKELRSMLVAWFEEKLPNSYMVWKWRQNRIARRRKRG